MIDKKWIYFGLGALSLGLTALEGCMIKNIRDRKLVNHNSVPVPAQVVNQVKTNVVNLQPRVNKTFTVPKKNYVAFPFKEEIPFIEFHAKRVGIEPELLMAVRMAENGRPGREYGILPGGASKRTYHNDKGYEYNGKFYPYRIGSERQMAWSARTLANALGDFHIERGKGFRGDRIDYLQKVYAPSKAGNDPRNLNGNWKGNVQRKYHSLKASN